jgi:hypothetical protein
MLMVKILLVSLLFLLSPGFWQIPQILKEENFKATPVWQVSEFEMADINQARGWHKTKFEKSIAKIAWNRPAIVVDKFIKNTTILLDPNFYFFGEHPRERLEPKARQKLPVIYLPLLVWGLWVSKKLPTVFLSLVFIFALLGLTNNLVGLILSISLLYYILNRFTKP